MFQIKKQINIYVKVALLLLLIVLKHLAGINIPVSFILMVFIGIAFISSDEEIVCLAISCIPMSTAFQYKYALVGCIIILLIRHFNKIKISRIVIPIALMMVWELLHFFIGYFSFSEYLRGFSELLFLLVLIITIPQKKIDYFLVCRTLAISVLIMGSVVLFSSLKRVGFDIQQVFIGTYRLGVSNADAENFGVNFNANGLGAICNLAIVGLLQTILSKSQKKIDYILLILLSAIGIMTMSRNFILCFACIVACFIIAGDDSIRHKIKRILTILILILILYYIVYEYLPTLYQSFKGRFQEEDLTNGRADLFAFYNHHIFSEFKYMFFGIGVQNFQEKIQNIYGSVANVCHNGIQELVVSWGIPGLVLFCWFIFELIKKSKKISGRYTIINFIPLIFILINIQSGQMIRAGHIMLSFSLIYLSMITCFETQARGKLHRV